MINRIKQIKNLIGSTFSKPSAKKIGKSRGNGEFLLRETDFGTVHVEAAVIGRYVERMKVFGVHEIQNIVVERPVGNVPLNIRLSLIIEQNQSAPKIGADLRDAIKEMLRETFSIHEAIFDIRVTQINQNVEEPKKPRVR